LEELHSAAFEQKVATYRVAKRGDATATGEGIPERVAIDAVACLGEEPRIGSGLILRLTECDAWVTKQGCQGACQQRARSC
jgi:hypothetical protein